MIKKDAFDLWWAWVEKPALQHDEDIGGDP
jgi:hypothetical protein